MKEDSFPLWSIYADNEKGCNIEFGKDFFDIDGAPYNPKKLREYMMSKYSDKDYPLYIVHYIEEELRKHFEIDFSQGQWQPDELYEIYHTKAYSQVCGTNSLDYRDLLRLFVQIIKRWYEIDEFWDEITLPKKSIDAKGDNENLFEAENVLEDDETQVKRDAIFAFIADRLNEIRFLFKDEDYRYEGEVRVVYTVADADTSGIIKTDDNLYPPRVYVNMERELSDLTIRLGSRIEDADVDKYVTWLKHTHKVRQVKLAKRNRYTL